MKRILALALVCIMTLGFAACSEDIHAKSEGVMTYEEYAAAELDTEVTVECFVQAHQSWWFDSEINQGKITVYAQDKDGAYFLYEMACTEEDAAKLEPGTKIRVKGYKSEWQGEIEITEATFEILDGTWTAEPMDATSLLGKDELIDHQNKLVSFTGMTVEACNEAGDAFQYDWDGSGQEGSDADLYFNASIDGKTYTFVIEYYLTGADSDVYKAVQALKVGDVIDMEGFLYWYQGANPHITSITVK